MLTIGVSKENDKLVITDSITLNVNGRRYKFSVGDGVGDVSPSETLQQQLQAIILPL